MRNALKWSALVLLILGLTGVAARAQSQGGGLQGRVVDEAGQPVVGATIQVTGPALQGFQGTATDLSGQYIIPFLPVGKHYEVKVEAPSYNTIIRKGIEVPLGMTISLPFTLSQGKTEIVVTAAAPLIDSKKTEVGANISDRMINSIPLGRNSSNIAFLAPSAVPSAPSPTGNRDINNSPAIAGGSAAENSYLINGVDVTSTGYGTNNSALNFDFIEATEVKTGGMDAEYGALLGGQVSSITKSGGNEFHGSLFAYYFDDGLGAKERRLNNPGISTYQTTFKQYDVGGSLGGYFLKDKLWFFAAYDYNKTDIGYKTTAGQNYVLLNDRLGPSWADTYKDTQKDPQYALKITWNISENHKLSASFFGDDFKRDYQRWLNNPVGNAGASPTKQTSKNWAVSAQWNAIWTPKFFTELVVSRRDVQQDTTPSLAAGLDNYAYGYYYGAGTYTGYQVIPVAGAFTSGAGGPVNLTDWRPSYGAQNRTYQHERNDQFRFKATNLFNFYGRHELSYGAQYYNIHYDQNYNYTGPNLMGEHSQIFDGTFGGWIPNPWYGQATSGGAWVRWRPVDTWAPTSNGSPFVYQARGFMNNNAKNTKQTYTAYWVQDNFNITDYFMLKVGLRLDQIHMSGMNNDTNNPGVLYPGHGYSTGQARHVNINDMWAPRIGFTWDIAHNNKSKLYGFYGQYYERIPNDMAVRALTDEYFYFAWYEDPGLTIPYTGYMGKSSWSRSDYIAGLYPTKIQGGPNGGKLKGSYNEEWILGFQYEIRPDFSMGVRAVYRSLGRIIEDISVDAATTYIVTNPDQWTNVWVPDAGGNPNYWYRFPKPVRIYRALEITADKRFSKNWMMQGSYVLSRLEGNYEGLFSNDNGQLDPNITSKYDIPSLLVNGYGLMPNDRTHVIKLFGGYFFDNIPLELSTNFTLYSGTPISKLGSDSAYGTDEGFCTPRGTAGRTPTIWSVDLGAQYSFKLWKSNLALRADIFNVTNEQRTTAVSQTYNTIDTSDHQTDPNFKKEIAHQQARRIRVAIRWTF